MHTNEGSNEKKPLSTLMELLDQLDQLVGHSREQSQQYRQVLRTIDHQNLSWEQPQPDGEEVQNSPDSHVSKLAVLVAGLRDTVNKNTEMLEHFNKLV